MHASASWNPGSRLLTLFSDRSVTTKNTLFVCTHSCTVLIFSSICFTLFQYCTVHKTVHICRLQVQLQYYRTSLHCNCNQFLATGNILINTVLYCKMNWLVSINIQRMMITVVIASSLQLKFGWACLAVEAVDLLTSTFSSLVSDHHIPPQGKTQCTV